MKVSQTESERENINICCRFWHRKVMTAKWKPSLGRGFLWFFILPESHRPISNWYYCIIHLVYLRVIINSTSFLMWILHQQRTTCSPSADSLFDHLSTFALPNSFSQSPLWRNKGNHLLHYRMLYVYPLQNVYAFQNACQYPQISEFDTLDIVYMFLFPGS